MSDELNIPLIEEIIIASSTIEVETGESVSFVGLSYDAFLQIKSKLEDSLGRNIKASDIDSSLALTHFIIPGLKGINYKFAKELTVV